MWNSELVLTSYQPFIPENTERSYHPNSSTLSRRGTAAYFLKVHIHLTALLRKMHARFVLSHEVLKEILHFWYCTTDTCAKRFNSPSTGDLELELQPLPCAASAHPTSVQGMDHVPYCPPSSSQAAVVVVAAPPAWPQTQLWWAPGLKLPTASAAAWLGIG